MISFPLSIRCASATLRPATAWLLPGDDVGMWLNELAQWQVPLATLTLRVLPSSARDRKPAGVLVTVAAGHTPHPTSRAIPYGLIAKRLYLPVEARIEPPVTDAELQTCLVGDVVVLHPTIGLVGFESGDALGIGELIVRPRRREAVWDRGQTGVMLNTRLLSVEPTAQPTVEMFLREARGDIGTQSPEQLPPGPGESSADQGPGSQAAAWLGQQLAETLRWFSGMLPHTPGKTSWADRLDHWAREKLTPQVIQSARERETQRLLRLLETDPEEGLRFALPIGSGDATRGVAPPSNYLPPRDVNFNLNRLGGGAAADHWSLPWQVQQQLTQRYRALADREVRLGRHRRAAYIHAELLGDLAAAAAVLTQGRHYLEAAVLLRDRLNRPLDAARCLEQGGLWSEAIALYESLGEYETVGELYLRLERPEQAIAAFRKQVAKRQAAGELVEAAHLLEHKVHVPEEALALLTAGWPGHKQAGRCLEEGFHLLGRLGRHADAANWIKTLRCSQTFVGNSSRLVLTQSLATVAASYPDTQVRYQAADITRVIAGEYLIRKGEYPLETSAEEKITPIDRRMVLAVTQLAPEDRLLARDGRRFLSRAERETPKPPVKRHGKHLQLLTSFQLPRDVEWSRVAVAGDKFYIAGFASQGPVLVRGLWNGALDRTDWQTPLNHRWTLMLEPERHVGQSVLLGLYGGPKLPTQDILASDGLMPITAETPTWLPPSTVAVARTPLGVTWSVARVGDYTLFGYDATGALLHNRALPILTEHNGPASIGMADVPWPMLARGDSILVGIYTQLVRFSAVDSVEVQSNFDEPIRGLTAPPPHHPFIVAVTFEHGGVYLSGDFDPCRGDRFASDLIRPVAGFTEDGWLVAVSAKSGEVYDTRNHRVLLRRRRCLGTCSAH